MDAGEEERALIATLLAAALLTTACTSTGDLEIIPFESKVFPAPRQLRILLPEGYRAAANKDRRYPVLYMNDGQFLFDVCTMGSQESAGG